jgi:hypothetical protein
VQQHTTQFLLSRVAQRIANLEHENYTIPVASNKRKTRDGAIKKQDAAGLFFYSEQDYADAEIETVVETETRDFAPSIDNIKLKSLTRINAQIERVLHGGSTTTAQLRTLLTQQQYEDYTASLTDIRDNTELMYGDGMPQELADYNAMLKRADFAFGKAEKMSGMQNAGLRKYKMGAVAKVASQSQSLYERAVERLEEIFSDVSGEDKIRLEHWMDREVLFGADGNTSIDCEGVPRVRGSKSHYAQDAGLPKLSKQLKRTICSLIALRDAASDIAFVPIKVASDDLNAEQELNLRGMLSNLKLRH